MKGIPFRQQFLPGIASGDKTQTRRLRGLEEINKAPSRWNFMPVISTSWVPDFYDFYRDDDLDLCTDLKSYYRPGETVYVKEAWANLGDKPTKNTTPVVFYKACIEQDLPFATPEDAEVLRDIKWSSPMFMPAWAARLFLRILSAEPQRFSLASMTPQDIEAEGGDPALNYLKDYDGKWLWKYCFEKVERPHDQ